MYGPFIENRSARGIVADQRKRFGLRDRTLKGDEEEPVAVWTPNGRIVRLAQPRRALADGVEHGLNVGRRVRDGAKNLAGRRLSLQRVSKVFSGIGKLAGPLAELLFEIGGRGTEGAPSGHLLAPVRPCCLSAARLHGCAACCSASAI